MSEVQVDGGDLQELEDEQLPDTLVTKFMKYFPPVILLLMILTVVIIWIVEGSERVLEYVTLIIGDSPSYDNLLQAFLIIVSVNMMCLPSSVFEVVIAYQLGWWAALPNITGDIVGCILSYLVGRQFFAIPNDSSSMTIQAVQKTIGDKPYQFALLLRVAPIPSGLKNYGSGAIGIPVIPFTVCTSILAPMFSLCFTLVGLSARGVVDEVSGEESKEDVPLWSKITLLVLVGMFTIGLTTYVLKSVHRELESIMEEAKAREGALNGDYVTDNMDADESVPFFDYDGTLGEVSKGADGSYPLPSTPQHQPSLSSLPPATTPPQPNNNATTSTAPVWVLPQSGLTKDKQAKLSSNTSPFISQPPQSTTAPALISDNLSSFQSRPQYSGQQSRSGQRQGRNPTVASSTPSERRKRAASDTPDFQNSHALQFHLASPSGNRKFQEKHPFASAFFSPQPRSAHAPPLLAAGGLHSNPRNATNLSIHPLRLLDEASNGMQHVMESFWLKDSFSLTTRKPADRASFHLMRPVSGGAKNEFTADIELGLLEQRTAEQQKQHLQELESKK